MSMYPRLIIGKRYFFLYLEKDELSDENAGFENIQDGLSNGENHLQLV